MRDIKFRSWNHGRMYYFDTPEDFKWFFGGDAGPQQKLSECGLMQYTGLKDKNGKEIYKGDIVRYTSRERTGTRVSYKRRGYDTYSVDSMVEIIGHVRFGEFDGVMTFIVDTEQVTKYESYFWGEGKRTDRPKIMTNSLVKALSTKREYEVLGNIYEHPHLIETPKASEPTE